MSTFLDLEQWNEELKLVSFCPVCETRNNTMEARLLWEQQQTRFLHVRCGKCKHLILAFVLVNQSGASSIGVLTDLSYQDMIRMKTRKSVSIDDVIDSHKMFETLDWERELGRTLSSRIRPVCQRSRQREKKEQKNKVVS